MSLYLSNKSQRVTDVQLGDVKTPEPTRLWKPLPHLDFVSMIRSAIERQGFNVTKQEFGIQDGKKDEQIIPGAKMFGLMTVENGIQTEGYKMAVGFRNSHDQSLAAGVFLGSNVMICDNLCYSGDIHVIRKHLHGNMNSINHTLRRSFERLGEYGVKQDNTFRQMQLTTFNDVNFHNLVCQCVLTDVFSPSKVGKVLKQWHEPNHAVFQKRNLWSAFNAVTEVAKETSTFTMPERMKTLHTICSHQLN